MTGFRRPANKSIYGSYVPWRRTPGQTGNGTVTTESDILEMFSHRLGVSKIVVFTDQAVKEFFKPGSAYLLQMDGVKFINGAFYWGLINGYSNGNDCPYLLSYYEII